jgi:hypothetical protein
VYVEADAAGGYLKMSEGDLLIVVLLEGGQLLLDALALDLVLEVLVLLHRHCQLVQTIEVPNRHNQSIYHYYIPSYSFKYLHQLSPSKMTGF